jgi:uncharacterized protein YndB with AHSA1/START domain
MRYLVPALALALAFATPAAAEVKSATPAGFEVQSTLVVAATPEQTYAMLGRIGQWWNKDHSWSGDAANLNLELRAGGCFCERLKAGGGVEHMRVVYAEPGKQLRLQGGLGPLQAEAVAGTLTWTLKAVPGGTEVTQNYVVGGYVRGGADKFAAPVDMVLGQQLAGLQGRLARGR